MLCFLFVMSTSAAWHGCSHVSLIFRFILFVVFRNLGYPLISRAVLLSTSDSKPLCRGASHSTWDRLGARREEERREEGGGRGRKWRGRGRGWKWTFIQNRHRENHAGGIFGRQTRLFSPIGVICFPGNVTSKHDCITKGSFYVWSKWQETTVWVRFVSKWPW